MKATERFIIVKCQHCGYEWRIKETYPEQFEEEKISTQCRGCRHKYKHIDYREIYEREGICRRTKRRFKAKYKIY